MSKIHGFMIDSARCLEKREFYERLIDFCAGQGMNTLLWHFSDDQGCSLDFTGVPGIGDPHAYSGDEMRALVRYAQDRGVTLIPELETLGHSRYLTRHPAYHHLKESDDDFTAICPLHPDTRALMQKLLRELTDIFPSEYIHVGLDEVNLGGHPLTAEALRTRREVDIFAEYVRFIHGELQALGRKMIMWVDQASYDTGLLDIIPADIVIALWQYAPEVTDGLTRSVLDKGFQALLCPGLITYDQQALPGDFALPNIERMCSYQSLRGRGEILGALTTIWTPMRYLHDCLWPALRVASDAMATGSLTLVRSVRSHVEDFHGAVPHPDLVQPLCRMFELSPRRDEYLAILKAEPGSNTVAHLQQRSEDWNEVFDCLSGATGHIRRERRAYETLCKFTGWMAYLYRRGAVLAEQGPGTILDDTLAAEGRDWLAWLETVWEHERFPDDPRRHTPLFPWERNEYLLINFRHSLSACAPTPEDVALSAS
ncbi:family 20 glycosylhydrolase [Ruficoccus amylovorans]|uniref:beta-N-acetylhexosaminidase n=1 Tax=Ruficoccus amylovorans TaxID=1804625 RepID=A0A842H9V2_9BACT|nr:family 20 glycosylhydrolase [Ruficoccus amylovorans]MBC2592909.1 family 20 glycosylhydrolase [Ruficoccus amylovorans]